MKITRSTAAALLLSSLLFVAAVPILAQDPPPKKRTTRENIVTLMLLRMTQVLELDEAQAAGLYPLVNRIEKEKLRLTRQAGTLLRELRTQLQEQGSDPPELRRLIDEIYAVHGQIKAMDGEVQAFVNENLTLEQQAKYMIFFQDFNQYLRNKIQEARQQPPRKKLPKAPLR